MSLPAVMRVLSEGKIDIRMHESVAYRLDVADALCLAMLARQFGSVLTRERQDVPGLLPVHAHTWIGWGGAIDIGCYGAPTDIAER